MILDLDKLNMPKRQRTSSQNRCESISSTSTSEEPNIPRGLRGTMITTQKPPNMNIIDFSDTISDVEEDVDEASSHCDNTRRKKRAKKHEKEAKDYQKKHKKEHTKDANSKSQTSESHKKETIHESVDNAT